MRQNLRWNESLVASDLGGTLIMKLLSFMEDQQAVLLDITEYQLRLRVGCTWWERWWHGLRGHAPLEINLIIRRASDAALEPRQRTHIGYSTINIAVRPLSRDWNPERFQTQAEWLVHRLRRHLMAG